MGARNSVQRETSREDVHRAEEESARLLQQHRQEEDTAMRNALEHMETRRSLEAISVNMQRSADQFEVWSTERDDNYQNEVARIRRNYYDDVRELWASVTRYKHTVDAEVQTLKSGLEKQVLDQDGEIALIQEQYKSLEKDNELKRKRLAMKRKQALEMAELRKHNSNELRQLLAEVAYLLRNGNCELIKLLPADIVEQLQAHFVSGDNVTIAAEESQDSIASLKFLKRMAEQIPEAIIEKLLNEHLSADAVKTLNML